MAKRRRVEAPSADELQRIEDEFRHETPAAARAALGPGRAAAPIAHVAGESAALSHAASPEARAGQARMRAELYRLKQAEAEGRLMADLPTAEIHADALVRDRTVLDEAEMLELRQSIAVHGLRLPVEVHELPEARPDGTRYALLSGYRRLMAVRGLHDLTEQEKYLRIRAIVRPAAEIDAAFVAMVEENEVRSDLSHYERGRIAVIAAQQGAFGNIEDAVNRLYSTGSKAKRSKVRSFAMIFEELGDMLEFAEALTEKRGLRLAQALRHGAEPRLRDALSGRAPETPEDEWALMEPVLAEIEAGPRRPHRGGRPKSAAPVSGWADAETLHTSAGITIRKQRDDSGFLLRFEGRGLDSDLMDSLIQEIRALLEKP